MVPSTSTVNNNNGLRTHLESDWLYEKNFASFDVPVPSGWPPGESSGGDQELPGDVNTSGSTGEEIDEALAEELKLPARRLRGLHSRASPRASKACEGCRK